MGKAPLSVLIHTYNEECNIANCLESVKWADDIVVVDMYSTDKTIELARQYTDRFFFFENMGYADPARQFALEKALNEWVLIVDADELVPGALRERIIDIIHGDKADVVYIPHKNYFFGKLIEGGGWGPFQDMHPRLFKKKHMRIGDCVHDFFQIDNTARIVKLADRRESFIHFAIIDVEQLIAKQNAYTTIEAKNIIEGKKRFIPLWSILLRKGLAVFFQRYILQKGYRDGIAGLYISFTRSFFYYLSLYIKARLMLEGGSSDVKSSVKEKYAAIARFVLSQYANNADGADSSDVESRLTQ